MRLRSATAGGPLHAGPLAQSLSKLVTKGSISLVLAKLEIGNCACVELQGVHLPLATTWLAEKLGGETEDRANELRVHGSTSDIKDG